MNNLKMILPAIAICLTLQLVCSCDKKTNELTKTTQDTLWNEHIQNVFFGVPFGATSQQVIDSFAKHDFILNKNISTKTWLSFDYVKGKQFSFGNLDWETLSVWLQNDKFSQIRFEEVEEIKDKDVAIDFFKSVVSELNRKYKLMKKEPSDTTCFGIYRGYGRDKKAIWIICKQSKSVSKETYIYTKLIYCDSTYAYAPSNEL